MTTDMVAELLRQLMSHQLPRAFTRVWTEWMCQGWR